MIRNIRRLNSSGAVFIELALSLPLILLLIAAILFISELINAKGQLRLAVTEGPRFAATRGNSHFFSVSNTNKTVHGPLETFITSGQSGTLPEILYLGINREIAKSNYSTSPTQWHVAADANASIYDFSRAHPIDVYALAYTYGMLRNGIPGIKYPCDPDPDGDSSVGRGCMLCQITNPLSNKDTCEKLDDRSADTTSACPYDRALPNVGVICMYHPSGSIAQIVDKFIRFFSKGNGGLPEMFLSASTYPPGVDTGGGHGGGAN